MTTTSPPLTYSPYAYQIHEDPYPVYARLRAEAPVYRNEELDFWALSRHEDVLAAFRNLDGFSNAQGVSLEPSAFGPDAHKFMSFLALDPPRHTRMRSLVGKGFTPSKVAQMEDHIRAIALEHLEPALERGTFDFIGDFAGKLPMDVISELVGVPRVDRNEVRRLADLVVHREDGLLDVPPAGMEAAIGLVSYYQEMVDERRRSRRDDLTSALLDAELDGDKLTDEEIIAFLFLMVVAGNETTTKLLGNAWYWGWRNSDQRAKPFEDRARVDSWIEETLRYDTSSQMLLRVTRIAHDRARSRDPPRQPGPVAGGLGQPGRDGLPRRRPLRPRPRHQSTGQLRQWPALLHGSAHGPARGPYRSDRTGRPGGHLRGRSVRDRAGPLHQRAGAGRPADHGDPALMPRFEDHPVRRPAVVTGASSGIGQATAVALAAQGHPVALGARRVAECEDTAAAIRADGGEAVAIHLDLADANSVEQFAKAAVDALGTVEIVVSNAAQNIAGTVLDTDSEAFDGVLAVNLSGTHRLVRALAPAMTERKRGDIVFVTSDVAERPRPSMAAYVTSKWGLEGYVNSLQMELEGTGVRATIVRPGPTLTGMGMDWDPAVTGQVIEEWVAWGFARHDNFMRPAGVAQAIVAVVGLARGTHATVIELQPEAPIRTDRDE